MLSMRKHYPGITGLGTNLYFKAIKN